MVAGAGKGLGSGAPLGTYVPDVFLRLRLSADLAVDFLTAVSASRRKLEQLASSVPWDEPWQGPDGAISAASVRIARHYFVRCRRTPAWVGLLAMIEDFAEIWDVGGVSGGTSCPTGHACAAFIISEASMAGWLRAEARRRSGSSGAWAGMVSEGVPQ